MSNTKPTRTEPLLLGAVAVACLFSRGSLVAQDGAGDIEGARIALEEWVEVRRTISREKREWAVGREMLSDRIALVTGEIESLSGHIEEAEASIAEADRKRAELVEENDAYKALASSLSETVGHLETRTKELLERLPEPIRGRVAPFSRRIPDDPESTEASLSERFQNVVGILNAVNRFNREITMTSEVRALPDGTSTEVTAVYVGIGQAYYANANGSAAGLGTATAEGWEWMPANEAAADVARVIAILKDEQPAGFAQLPVRIE